MTYSTRAEEDVGPDCDKCERRGVIRGFSQETYCEGCKWGRKDAPDYFKEATNVQR